MKHLAIPIGLPMPFSFNRQLGFSDPLTNLTGWTGAGAAIVGGKIVITPTVGNEIVTNGNMETGSPPSNWAGITATLTAAADQRTGGTGTQSLNVANNAGQGVGYQAETLTVDTWYLLTGWVKKVSSNAGLRMYKNGSPYTQYAYTSSTDTNWAQLAASLRDVFAGVIVQCINSSSTGTDAARYDDVSLKAITFNTTLLVKPSSLPTWKLVSPLASNLVTSTQMGVIFGLDSPSNPQNFALAYYDGLGKVSVVQCTNGTYGAVTETTSAWGATKKLSVIKSAASTYTVYNATTDFGTVVGSPLTLSGLTGQYYGLFSTYSGNQFDPAGNPFKLMPYGN